MYSFSVVICNFANGLTVKECPRMGQGLMRLSRTPQAELLSQSAFVRVKLKET
jgi:hypothetical protein